MLSGRLGGCRVLVLENDRYTGADGDEPTHFLLFGAADDKPRQGKDRS
jgi:hypothetical protein